jgi:hypothetical protein
MIVCLWRREWDSNPLLMEFSLVIPLFRVSLFIELRCIPEFLGKEGILLEWDCSWGKSDK